MQPETLRGLGHDPTGSRSLLRPVYPSLPSLQPDPDYHPCCGNILHVRLLERSLTNSEAVLRRLFLPDW